MAENRVVVESLKWAIRWAPSHQQRSLCNCSYLIQWVCFMADQDAECSTVTVIWDFWSVRKMFHFDGYLRFLISAKNVPLWRLFEVSGQYEGCSTVTVIWGFWSVRRMFHFDDYLRFLVSKKNVPLWRLFEISDQYEECSTVTIIWGFWSVRRMFHCDGYLRFLISTKNISVFLISTRISQCFSSVRDYLIVSHQYENISVFLISTRISHSFSSVR